MTSITETAAATSRNTSATATATATATVTVAWRCAEPGLWIASAPDGRPLGIVSERWGRGFVVTACTGRDLGMHRALADAQAALESSL